MHMFIVIVPNHAGADLQRYAMCPRSDAGGVTFLSAADSRLGQLSHRQRVARLVPPYAAGCTKLTSHFERHLFPNLSMRQYRLLQPRIKALCALNNGVSYIQQSVWLQLWKMLQIAIGKQQMLRSGLPTSTVAGDEATTLAGTQPASCDA
ncbi:MAG: hypothetical protein U1F55_02495 [Chitinivorax sp.]